MEIKQIAPETNEEILKRNGMDLGFWSPDTSSKILKSMQAYADQEKRKEAIAFVNWIACQDGQMKLVLVDNDWYWDVDKDGDQPLSESDLYGFYLKDPEHLSLTKQLNKEL